VAGLPFNDQKLRFETTFMKRVKVRFNSWFIQRYKVLIYGLLTQVKQRNQLNGSAIATKKAHRYDELQDAR